MDARLRDLSRQFSSTPTVDNASLLLRGLERSQQVPEVFQNLLAGLSQTPPVYVPSLYFACGYDDPEEPLEVTRIEWLRAFGHRFFWFILIRNLLDFVGYQVLSAKTRLEVLLRYEKPRQQIRRRFRDQSSPPTGHCRNNGSLEYQLLSENITNALQILQAISPKNGVPTKEVLQEQIQIWSTWGNITSDQGYLNLEIEDEKAWEKDRALAMALFNLVETLHHLFLALAGQGGEPERLVSGAFNSEYTGSPFLYHWRREHGSLNPSFHLNFGNLTRLNRLRQQDGTLDWFIVYSNCLAGCYLAYAWLLRVTTDVEEIVRQDQNRCRETLSSMEKQLQTALAERCMANSPKYRELREQADKLRQQFRKRKTGTSTKFKNLLTQMNLIRTRIFRRTPEFQALRQQIAEKENELHTISDQTEPVVERTFENRFWNDALPVFTVAIAEYLKP